MATTLIYSGSWLYCSDGPIENKLPEKSLISENFLSLEYLVTFAENVRLFGSIHISNGNQ